MTTVCVFIKYNGQWDSTSRYVNGEMDGLLVPLPATYVGLIELVMSVIGMRSLEKTIVMRYAVEPRMPRVRIQCDADGKATTYLCNLLRLVDRVMKPCNLLQPSRVGGQSDEAMQPVAVNILIIPSPILPHIPPSIISPIVGLDLHMEDGLEEQYKFLNKDLGMNHDDCNVGEFNIEEAARDSNERSTAGSIRAQFVVNRTRTQSVHISDSDNFSSIVVIADFTPITMHVKRSTTTLLHVVCIDNEKCPWQLRATRMKGIELFVVERYNEVHSCSIEIVQGHHHQVKSWMIGECVKAKYVDLTNTSYRPREIMWDMHDEFGVSFNYLRAW
ncbi:hypothetical protein TIFTF001_027435 [Ficus carica]|uniref:Transposase MuDR plant domain-containing protein n=1 Tax=Ficus carica TaxID=3494 RepID=A0AA88DN19_FICCA|nr:hypothetical protein TIFTF001_027435 [Ficus carica]